MTENLVNLPPGRVVLAMQHWQDDEARAMRVARLLADLEPRRRDDVLLAFCRRFDMPEESELGWKTRLHCGFKFPTISIRSPREGTGHPDGCAGLAMGTVEYLAEAWSAGTLDAHSVLLLESDGVPLRPDWLDRFLADHARTLEAGKRVTGPAMHRMPHINGTLAVALSLWHDRPSLHRTPPGQAWDLFHAQVLMSEARPSGWMRNTYGAPAWSDAGLAAQANEVAWLCSQKDDSALSWAERHLAPRAAAPSGPRSCTCPDPWNCMRQACPCPCVQCAGAFAPTERRFVHG